MLSLSDCEPFCGQGFFVAQEQEFVLTLSGGVFVRVHAKQNWLNSQMQNAQGWLTLAHSVRIRKL